MSPRNALRTTTFRLALAYLAIFVASSATLLGFIYWATSGAIDRESEQIIEAELTGLREQYRQWGIVGLVRVIEERSKGDRADEMRYIVVGPRFERVTGNLSVWPPELRDRRGLVEFPLSVRVGDRSEKRQTMAMAFDLPNGFRLLVGRDTKERSEFRERVIGAIAWSLALTLAFGLMGGYWVSRHLMRRVDAINRTSGEIRAGDLQQRVPVTGKGDEFDQLALNLNAMLDQIERLMGGMRQVTNNIAHDMRTPLNRLRARLEVTLIEKPDEARYREAIQETIDEADRLIATFNAMLSIAEAESGSKAESLARTELAPLVDHVAELYEPLAEEKGLTLTVAHAGVAVARADRHLMSQAVANLLDNAIKYAPAPGAITVRTADTPLGAEITVTDTGPGIPPESREAVLARFVRLEQSRSTPGNGLGLSLVQAVAKMHGAELTLADNAPGLAVTLRFPPIRDARPPAK
ncbi:signal transduction histidine kinase [Stella humosa]|uniref:histidine kinase n=1 Tax=Stella humosa TaxID=94 RepID=A0A3N1M9M7_9PROT|nr:ATP-binding protein [Stella humosa]ROP99744.1 signal transduction histidine kinase [Stella humosa]BBK31029.1 two-component sensor histidine kinase [Stella humosa]